MSEQFNRLTPAEHERLAVLLEELGEAQQIIGKILRHGYESFNPCGNPDITNRMMLENEIGHVFHAAYRLMDTWDLAGSMVMDHAAVKQKTIRKYLHHQPDSV